MTKFVAEHSTRGDRRRVRSVVTAGALYYLGLGVVALPLAYFLGPYLIDHLHLAPGLRAQAPSVLLGAFAACVMSLLLWSTLSALVNGLGHLRVTAAAGAVGQTTGAIATVTLLVVHVGIWSMVIGLYVQVLTQCAIAYVYVRRTFGPVFISPFAIDRSVFRLLFAFGAWIQISTISGLLGIETVQIMVGVMLGVEQVALLDLGSRIARAVRVLAYHLNAAFLPAVAAHEAEHGAQSAQNTLADASRYAALISFGATGLLVAAAPVAPHAWLGNHAIATSSVTLVVAFLALTYLVDNSTSIAGTTLRAIGKPWVETTGAVVYATANIGFVAILAPRIGLLGVLIGTLASSVLAGIVFLVTFTRVRAGAMGLVFGSWTPRLLAACVIATTASVGAARAIPQGGRPAAVVALIVTGVVYAAVLIPALRLTGFFGLRDVAFARRLLPVRLASWLDSRAARMLFGTV